MNPLKLPDSSYLNDVFEYREGVLYWKINKKGVVAGTAAGCLKDGYTVIRLDDKLYKAHRLIWKMQKGTDPERELDHINRNRNDNRIENLRDVSRMQNAQNVGAKGYNYWPSRNKYQAQIMVNGKKITLGYFDTAEEASSRYREFKELYMEMLNA